MKRALLHLSCMLVLTVLACAKEEGPMGPPPPPQVNVIQTVAREIPIYQEFVGQVYGYKDIAIAARVEGYLEGIHFEEGTRVQEGKLLYTLESQQFEADVAAKMSGLAGAKTMLTEAETYLNRIRPLAMEKAVSQSDLDAAVAQYEVNLSSVQAAEANLRAARIQLGYTRVYSPITGIIGKTQAKVGDFVGRAPNPIILNVVSRIDKVLVEFFITESQYLLFMREHLAKTAKEQSGPRDEFNLDLILTDGTVYDQKGRADFVNREVDPKTGAILIQASFPNPDELLRPGQFARVRGIVELVKDGILIPQRCVMELQGSFSVYVLGPENSIERREVKTGPRMGSFWLIRAGLEPGEQVVYEGFQKVREGTVVEPVLTEIPFPDETAARGPSTG